MQFHELSEEQKAKVRSAKSVEEILAIAREEGYELSDSELEAVSGGEAWNECGKDTNSGPY